MAPYKYIYIYIYIRVLYRCSLSRICGLVCLSMGPEMDNFTLNTNILMPSLHKTCSNECRGCSMVHEAKAVKHRKLFLAFNTLCEVQTRSFTFPISYMPWHMEDVLWALDRYMLEP